MNSEYKKAIDSLYLDYGYEKISKNEEKYIVFKITQGAYTGIDIVSKCSIETEKIKEYYQKAGFATRVFIDKSIEYIRADLFENFFNTKHVNHDLKRRHSKYIEKQESILQGKYSYINCNFVTSLEHEDIDIISLIMSIISNKGPQLIILEASAGFGKTSTAYKLLDEIIKINVKLPIFTELSKNRQAKIFRYVLLDEIDRTYFSVKSSVVLKEIKSGRIPIIVDGFDELLFKANSQDKTNDDFETVSAMLETIGELLVDNAKIVLTTRKTALFAGDDFHLWIEDKIDKFTTTKITIEKPNIVTWIGNEKLKKLEEISFPIEKLSSPILLTYFKNLSEDDFIYICKQPDKIVRNFLYKILERERVRQSLTLTVSEQIKIFRNLASEMASYGISAENKKFISELISENDLDVIADSITRYSTVERPTVEILIETLTNHAFLDRFDNNLHDIGFVNQFIFGTLLGDFAKYCDENWLIDAFASEYYIMLAASAYAIQSLENRCILHDKILLIDDCLSEQNKLLIDILLKQSQSHNFIGAYFEKLEISNFSFGEKNECSMCSFLGISFHKCKFNLTNISDCTFIDCVFNECTYSGDKNSLSFIECDDFNAHFISSIESINKDISSTEVSMQCEIQRKIIRKFIPEGRHNKYTKLQKIYMFKGFSAKQHTEVYEILNDMFKKEFMFKRGEYICLNTNKIDELITLL